MESATEPSGVSPAGSAHRELDRREREILAFEGQWWKYAGAKEQAIRELFDMSATRYYQVLNALVDKPEALAAEAGFAGVIQVLLDHGADINARTGGQNRVTPLHMAAAKGRSAVVKMLLQAGAEVNVRDIKEQTPLHWALAAEQPDCADIIRIFGGTE